jgi:hypothetical protein
MTDPALPSRIIQLVARFRPDADGVGETALNLANVLLSDYGIRSDFLVFKSAGSVPELDIPEGFPHSITRLDWATAAFDGAVDRLAALSATAPVMLIHYASYGYSQQGTPFWLPPAAKRFVKRGGRVVTLFHELYARPRFPTKTFITSGFQKAIFRRLLAAGDAGFTSNEDYLETMRRANRANRPVSLIGICSSAGEPARPGPLAPRARRLAVFGRFATRKILYTRHLKTLARVAEHLGVEEIADMGAVEDAQWMKENVYAPLGKLVKSYGTLSVDDASRLLGDSMVGAIAYRYELRGKSSIYAAYQAHANAILLFPDSDIEETREAGSWSLSADELLASPAGSAALFDRLQKAATDGREHYDRFRSVRSMVETMLPALWNGAAKR